MKLPIRISMTGYSIKDADGLIIATMPGKSDHHTDMFGVWLNEAEQIVDSVNKSQQAAEEMRERCACLLEERATHLYNTYSILLAAQAIRELEIE